MSDWEESEEPSTVPVPSDEPARKPRGVFSDRDARPHGRGRSRGRRDDVDVSSLRKPDGFIESRQWHAGGFGRGDRGRRFGQDEDEGSRDRSRGAFGATQPEEGTTLYVNSSDVGRIIGRGGERIRELENKSGARIKVHRGSTSRVLVIITGGPDVEKVAQDLIEELVTPLRETTTKFGGMGFSDTPQPPKDTYAPPPFKKIDWSGLNANRAHVEAEKWGGLPAVVKDFYIEDPAVANMSALEVDAFREENNDITVVDISEGKARLIPNPVKTFEQALRHHPSLLLEMEKAKFVKPTPIQCQSWPILLQGYDMVGIAQTGTGKTLAFLLPALIHLEGQSTPKQQRSGPTVLILSPTRELALQIEMESKKFSFKGVRCVCVYGGGNRKEQIDAVSRGVEVVIATPGRLNDLLMNEFLDMKCVSYLVLDEADRMLDMGFEPQIRKILLDIRPDRQTVMTRIAPQFRVPCATWPADVRRLADSYLSDPFQVCVGSLDLRACNLVEQRIEFLDDSSKKRRVVEFIQDMKEGEKALIFTGRKVTADDLSSDLTLQGLLVQCIHGDREQYDREQALDDFKTGEVPVLIATDVASRGLDIKDITYVVNYDFPRHIEDYVHRVGRTGRAGRSGKALSFFTRDNWKWAGELANILVQAQQEVPDELVAMAERYDAWRERKASEREETKGRGERGRGMGGHRGGRGRSRHDRSFDSFGI